MAIDDGGFGTGSGESAGTSREFNFWESGSSGGFSGEADGELDKFIKSTGKAKNALKELQSMMTGEGKDRITTFTTSLKKLNSQLEQTVGHLREAKDIGFPQMGGLTGRGSSTPNGGDVVMPDQARLQQQHARDVGVVAGGAGRGGGGTFSPAGAGAPGDPQGGGFGTALAAFFAGRGGANLATAGRVGMLTAGAAFAAGSAGSALLEGQRDEASYMEFLAQQSALVSGTSESWSARHMRSFLDGNFASVNEFRDADMALRGMGLGPGTASHDRITRDVSGMLYAQPDANAGQLAAMAGSLQYGQTAMNLRMRGITSYEQSTPDQMRSILRSAAGGQEPTAEGLAGTQPGTVVYANLMSLLGGNEQLVHQVLEFGRADARGQARGSDVTTRGGARDVFGENALTEERAAGGAEAATLIDRLGDVSEELREASNAVEEFQIKLREGTGPVAKSTGIVRDFFEGFSKYTRWMNAAYEEIGPGPLIGGIAAYKFGVKPLVTGAMDKIRGGPAGTPTTPTSLNPLAAQTPPPPTTSIAGKLSKFGKWLKPLAPLALAFESKGVWDQGAEDFRQMRENQDERGFWRGLVSREGFDDEVEPAGGLLNDSVPVDAVRGADHEGEEWRRPLSFGGVQEHVRRAGNYINKMFGPFPGNIGGRGDRANKNSDHPRGLALDFMTNNNKALGDRVSNFMTRNAQHFGVKYVIWRQRINNLRGKGWEKMEDRGSDTANHEDHPHVSFHSNPGAAAGADPGDGLWGDDGTPEREQSISRGAPGGGQGGGWSGSRDELETFNAFFGGAFGTGSPQEQDDSPDGMFEGGPDSFGSYQGEFSGDPVDVAKVAARAGWRGNDLVTAVAVALAESRGNPRADAPGSEDSRGLWQINSVHHGRFNPRQLYDPQYNADAAYALWKDRPSWADWSVHPASSNYTPRNSYTSFMNTAKEAVGSLQQGQDHFGSSVEPAGGLSTDIAPSGASSSPSAAPVGMVPPSSPGLRGGGVTQVNVNFKIERATYEEAEKFASWVMEITDRKQGLARVGSR